ncbi:hypothetical protein CRG98_008731 [Punica granatum]|uniref:Retrotransposon gag domain-containing protein n=1 Tax=Punica granatum TaxID=22663 RepID=A0A2I0KRB3_PUNGR|nr:hypothetical protein CRG98_008731 [Punica granatum]
MWLPPKIKDSLAGVALDWYMSLKAADIPTWADLSSKFINQYKYCAETPPTLLELSTMEIQLFHSTLTWAYYLHLLAHTSSFSSLIDAVKKLDMGIKLGKIKGPTEKEGQSSKNATTAPSLTSNKKGRDACVNAVSLGRQTPMPLALGAPPSAQRALTLHPRKVGQARPHLQYPPLPVPQSQVYRQLLAAKEIRPMAPHPQFNPANQDQNLRCEYHMGASGHTTDDYYTLRGKLQEMIEKNQLSFNEVKPPNVQANPVPDHGSSSDAVINLIGICPMGKDKAEEEKLISP